jgi:hypothetical protein
MASRENAFFIWRLASATVKRETAFRVPSSYSDPRRAAKAATAIVGLLAGNARP